jgi:type II secretory pathway component PulC
MVEWQTELDKLRRDHRTPLIITAFLGILLLLAIWQFAETFITSGPTVTTITQPAPAPLQNLANLHLFGVYASNLDSLPATQLPFILEGTIVFLDAPNQSRALVSSSSGPAKVYQVGSALPGNATITRIAKEYVVLNYNGSLEKLALPIHILTSNE